MTTNPTDQAARAAAREKAAEALFRDAIAGLPNADWELEDEDVREHYRRFSQIAIDAYLAALPPASVEAEREAAIDIIKAVCQPVEWEHELK